MDNILPLQIIDVVDRGIPNLERIVLRANDFCSLTTLYIGIGFGRSGGSADPINDNLLWLGRGSLLPDDLMVVYTGHGVSRMHEVPNQPYQIFTIFWGRNEVLFSSQEIVPYLFQMGPTQVFSQHPTLSQSIEANSDDL